MSSGQPRKYEQNSSNQRVIEIAAGLLLVAVSIALLFWVIPANVGHSASQHDISPDFIPKTAAWTLLVLSLALIIDRVVKTTDLRESFADSTGGVAILVQLCLWLVVAAIAYAGIAYLSFYVTAAALIVVGSLVCRYHQWRILAVVALVAPVSIAQISWWVFSVKFD